MNARLHSPHRLFWPLAELSSVLRSQPYVLVAERFPQTHTCSSVPEFICRDGARTLFGLDGRA